MNPTKKRFSLDEDDDVAASASPRKMPSRDAEHEHLENDIQKLVGFLKYPENKRRLAAYLMQTYKELEREEIERIIARVAHAEQSEREGSKPHHRPGHLGPLMYEHLGMGDVENAFVQGLKGTQSSMTKKNRSD